MADLRDRSGETYAGMIAVPAALLSFFVTSWFYRNGDLLLYGDAVAHINIARRLFDCMEPGYRQLGSVWLPLPHLLVAPFVYFDKLWQSGLGGSLPTMAAYVLSVVGIYRLVVSRLSQAAAWIATAIFAFNPSLLYMQATAMNEPIFLAEMIWATVFLNELELQLRRATLSAEQAMHLLSGCGCVLAAAILTRYDGWFFSAACGLVVLVLLFRSWRTQSRAAKRALIRGTVDLFLLCALVPILWMAHNYSLNKKPLDFFNGPYSAKAVAERSTAPGAPPYPGKDHPGTAALYLLKAAQYNMAEGRWQPLVLTLAVAGTVLALAVIQGSWLWLLLWIPLPFYALSIAYGSVPIFIPGWWPFSYYNVRYGLELVPALAVFIGVLAHQVSCRAGAKWIRVGAVALVVLLVSAGYWSSWRATPICLREARVNGRARTTLQAGLARFVRRLPPNSILLMRTGEHVGVLQEAGFPMKRVIWEGVFHGWEAALYNPAGNADYVLAFEGDIVSEHLKGRTKFLEPIVVMRVSGQATATLYRSTLRKAPAL